MVLSAHALLDSEHSSLDPIHLTELVFQPQAIVRVPALKKNECTWSQRSSYHLPKWGATHWPVSFTHPSCYEPEPCDSSTWRLSLRYHPVQHSFLILSNSNCVLTLKRQKDPKEVNSLLRVTSLVHDGGVFQGGPPPQRLHSLVLWESSFYPAILWETCVGSKALSV